jgi:two-component system, OmpR family, KDP operon response regulator KdpE
MSRSAAFQPLVLVVDEDPHLGQSLVSTLASHGFRTLHAATRDSALTRAVGHEPDLILLNVVAPTTDSVGLTSRLRASASAPIVLLLDRSGEREKSVLDAGANDFIIKPFSTADLLARIRVWLRESARTHVPRYLADARADRIRIDRERRSIFVEGREVHITPIECKLLLTLARCPGKALSEEQILSALWGPGSSTRAQYLRAHVRQLRQKIESDPGRPRHLVTDVTGGYRLKLR